MNEKLQNCFHTRIEKDILRHVKFYKPRMASEIFRGARLWLSENVIFFFHVNGIIILYINV